MCTILANKEKKMQLKSHKATTDPISHKISANHRHKWMDDKCEKNERCCNKAVKHEFKGRKKNLLV